MMNAKKQVLLGGVAMALVLTAAPAMAQAPADDDAHVANEITVTARRREESILKVPVVASVLSSEELVRTGTADLSGISARVPGLNLGTSVSSFGTQVSLRGIGTSTLNASIDQSVSLNIDGMQITRVCPMPWLLRCRPCRSAEGPQALFYGKASPAGVISVRSADPTDQFEVIARAGYEFEAREAKANWSFLVRFPIRSRRGSRPAMPRRWLLPQCRRRRRRWNSGKHFATICCGTGCHHGGALWPAWLARRRRSA